MCLRGELGHARAYGCAFQGNSVKGAQTGESCVKFASSLRQVCVRRGACCHLLHHPPTRLPLQRCPMLSHIVTVHGVLPPCRCAVW